MRLIDADALKQKAFGKRRGLIHTSDIDAMPTVEPQHWIPCSETKELPKHEVLCCDEYGEELIGWLSYDDDQWLCESEGEMMYDPIAWREKPEPYKESETDG